MDKSNDAAIANSLKSSMKAIREGQLKRIVTNEDKLFAGVKFESDNEKLLLDTLLNGDEKLIWEFYTRAFKVLNGIEKDSSIEDILSTREGINKTCQYLFASTVNINDHEAELVKNILKKLQLEFLKNKKLSNINSSASASYKKRLDTERLNSGNASSETVDEKKKIDGRLKNAILGKIIIDEMDIEDMRSFLNNSRNERGLFVRDFLKKNISSKLPRKKIFELYIRLDSLALDIIRDIVIQKEEENKKAREDMEVKRATGKTVTSIDPTISGIDK